MKNILLLWDIDGTLMHCGSNGTAALNATFKELYQVEDAFHKIKIGTAMDSFILKDMMKYFHIDESHKNEIMKVYEKKLAEILEENQGKRVLDGVENILKWTQTKENVYNAILTSNFKVGADQKLSSVDLLHYFEFGGYGDLEGEKWDAITYAIEQVEKSHQCGSFDKGNIYLIGDTCYDIRCAKHVGIHSISVATGWTDYVELEKERPDYLFEDLKEWGRFLQVINDN